MILATLLFAAEQGSAGPDYVGELFVLGGIALTAIGGWIASIIVKKMREPVRIETLWSRLDAQDAKIGKQDVEIADLRSTVGNTQRVAKAGSRIIRDLARQWPSGHIPRLNPEDIAELEEDTVPTHWKVKPS